jgi:hypothetical protein
MSARLGGLLLVLACFAAPLAAAQDKAADVTDMQALRDAVRADKRKYVASLMTLTDAEAKRFWPVYDKYQHDLDIANRDRVVAVQEFMFRDKPLTNLAAKQYATRLLALDEAEIKARRTMRNRVMRALPAVKAARYMMLEQKINAAQDYDLAATVPLVR